MNILFTSLCDLYSIECSNTTQHKNLTISGSFQSRSNCESFHSYDEACMCLLEGETNICSQECSDSLLRLGTSNQGERVRTVSKHKLPFQLLVYSTPMFAVKVEFHHEVLLENHASKT
jgi:hypothetical protein